MINSKLSAHVKVQATAKLYDTAVDKTAVHIQILWLI